MKSKSGKYISRQQPMGWKCWVVTSQQSRPGIPVTKLLLLARTRRGHLQQQPLGNWQTDTFECIVVPPVAFQCNSSRQGVPRRSLGHASPPRPRPLHCGHVQRLIVSYVSTPVKSSKRYSLRVLLYFLLLLLLLLLRSRTRSTTSATAVGVGVDVFLKERRGLESGTAPPRPKSRALL